LVQSKVPMTSSPTRNGVQKSLQRTPVYKHSEVDEKGGVIVVVVRKKSCKKKKKRTVVKDTKTCREQIIRARTGT